MIDLRLGNCLDLFPTLAPRSIDAVIADIPYGTTACKWDTVIPFEPMWEQLKRIARPKAAIVLFGSQPFTSALVMSNPKWFRYEWVWHKPNGTNPYHAKTMPNKVHEYAVVFSENGATYNPQMRTGHPYKWNSQRSGGDASRIRQRRETPIKNTGTRYPISILDYKQERGFHPTQKPVALMEYLVKTYTNEGDTVLDFTMGSGTTGVACVKTNRNFVGFEILPEYFEIAQRRIVEAQQQMVML